MGFPQIEPLIRTLTQGSESVFLLSIFGIWTIVMISVPLVARVGVAYRGRAITIGVVAQVALVVSTLFTGWTVSRAIVGIALVPVLGWTAEFIGSRTGIPFGKYHYTSVLQPQLKHVPIAIPFAWLMMLPPSWAIAQLLIPDGSRLLIAIVSGAAFMAWDIYLDPHLVRWDFWRWEEPGVYLGIPLKNFFGWFLWAAAITFAVNPAPLSPFPLVLVYILTWLFQFGGHIVFWRWPISGIAGFCAMGIFTITALLRSFPG